MQCCSINMEKSKIKINLFLCYKKKRLLCRRGSSRLWQGSADKVIGECVYKSLLFSPRLRCSLNNAQRCNIVVGRGKKNWPSGTYSPINSLIKKIIIVAFGSHQSHCSRTIMQTVGNSVTQYHTLHYLLLFKCIQEPRTQQYKSGSLISKHS